MTENEKVCYKCKKLLKPHHKVDICVTVTNRDYTKKTKTIGCLCQKCYRNLIDNIDLGTKELLGDDK